LLSKRVAVLEKENKELSAKVVEAEISGVASQIVISEEVSVPDTPNVLEASPCQSQIDDHITNLQKANTDFEEKNKKYKVKIDVLESTISRLKNGLKDLYFDFNKLKKDFSESLIELQNYQDRNARLESQLGETMVANGNLLTQIDLLKVELGEERCKMEREMQKLEVLKNSENNSSKSCPMCITLTDEKFAIEAERDRLQALVDIYLGLEDESRRSAELDDEGLEELLKKQEEYMNSFLTYRSHQESADWNFAQRLAKEEADGVEIERLKLQENDADFAMRLSAKYREEDLSLKKQREAEVLQNVSASKSQEMIRIINGFNGDVNLARKIAADEIRQVRADKEKLVNKKMVNPRVGSVLSDEEQKKNERRRSPRKPQSKSFLGGFFGKN